MVRPEGVEPPTYWFVASCSIQLSYGRTLRERQLFKDTGFRSSEQPAGLHHGSQKHRGTRVGDADGELHPDHALYACSGS